MITDFFKTFGYPSKPNKDVWDSIAKAIQEAQNLNNG